MFVPDRQITTPDSIDEIEAIDYFTHPFTPSIEAYENYYIKIIYKDGSLEDGHLDCVCMDEGDILIDGELRKFNDILNITIFQEV